MKTIVKKGLGAGLLAFLFVGCADSGQGGAADYETETVTSPAPVVNPSEPGVAPEPGTIPSVSSNYVYEAPARPVPQDPETTTPVQAPEPSEQPQTEANEQGAQRSPEPRTGDDANPDSINPRE